MGLPIVEVRGFIPGMRFKLKSTATERSVKDLLKCSSFHQGCPSGKVNQIRRCSECGEINPEAVYVTPSGFVWSREKPEHPYFDVKGWENVRQVTDDLIKSTYLVEVEAGDKATANLCKALGRRAGIIGYLRTTVNSDERVAFLQSPEEGVLLLKVLYYLDTEATEPIKVVKEPSRPTPASKAMQEKLFDMGQKSVASLTRRELAKAQKAIEKEVQIENTKTKEEQSSVRTRKASR